MSVREWASKQGHTLKGFVTGVLVMSLVMLAGGYALLKHPSWNPFSTESHSSDETVIKSVRYENQVVLLSLGVQGIKHKEARSKVFGIGVPGSGRSMYLQYEYYAKLGIEGKDVKIQKIGEKKYRITVPKFVFIGHKDEKFELAVEDNGVTSFVTPEIDTAELITEIINDDAKNKNLDDNDEVLRSQAEAFYTGILHGIDPTLTAEFVFTEK